MPYVPAISTNRKNTITYSATCQKKIGLHSCNYITDMLYLVCRVRRYIEETCFRCE